ncbi:MAG: phosphoglycerate kinase [Minisyncoccia bacterium]
MIELKKEELLRFNQDKIIDKNVLVRVDFNVDFYKGKILDKTRIVSFKETLNFLKKAKRVILISHLGDPPSLINTDSERINTDKFIHGLNGSKADNTDNINPFKSVQNPHKSVNKYSLKKILPSIEKILKIKIGFLKDLNSKPKEKISLLENIRLFKGEKECDLNFAKKLSELGEVFINEAFSVSHRKHASVYLLPKLLKTYYGINFEKEINLLNKFLKTLINADLNTDKRGYNLSTQISVHKKYLRRSVLHPRSSVVLVLGGSKISTKLPLIEKFLKKNVLIILGGGLANTYLKAKDFEIGNSLFEEEILEKIRKIYFPNILIPFDFYVLNKNKVFHRFLGEIKKDDVIYDVGEESLKVFFDEIKKAKALVWNGPLGLVEDKRFESGTFKLIKFLLSLKGKFVLVGGGDTLAFLEKKKLLKKFKNISTGGGAMLEYLAKETLPIFEDE